MKRLVPGLAILALALAGNALLFLKPSGGAADISGTARIDLGGKTIEVARRLIRDRAQAAGGRLDRLDLAVRISDFSPLPPPDPADPARPMPERLTISLALAREGADSVETLQRVHARFLTRETWSNPGGLVMRRFRAGSPYEDRELYVGAGGGRMFVAICPREAVSAIEPCLTTIRIEGLDMELRFDARHLPEWRRFATQAVMLVAGIAMKG